MKKLITKLPVLAWVVFCMVSLSAAAKPITIYTCGDGTMSDHEVTATVARGWAQVLPDYLNNEAIVKNFAKIGSSTTSFLQDGTWETIRQNLHRGDVVILQFGHNDPKQDDNLHYASVVDFENNLVRIVKEAIKKKAKVILCTPIIRPTYSLHTNQWVDTHGAYPEAMRRVAQAEEVTLIDLTAQTAKWIGDFADNEIALSYFDGNYLNEKGAVVVAEMFVKDIIKQEVKFLSPYVK